MVEFLKSIWKWLTTSPSAPTPERDQSAEPLPMPEPEGPTAFANIEKALEFTLANEGGYSDHPNDNGGATKYGITIGDLGRYLGRSATKAEVKALTKKDAAEIYRKFYWDPLNLGRCDDQSIATVIFDMGVLCGIGKSAQWVQEILGVKIDRKIGPVTMAALNEALRSVFVPKFADKAQAYFNAIVAGNSSQKVFLKGWTNRANRLRTLAVNDPKTDESPQVESGGMVGEGLEAIAQLNGISAKRVQEMITRQMKNRPGKNPQYWAMIDFRLHSSERRFYLFDRINKTVEKYHTSHGSGSDTNHDGRADKFSNTPGSHCSSLGFYQCADTYTGKHGTSLRLEGKEVSNSNAKMRAVVIHTASYVGPDYVRVHGKCGRSQGCPALALSIGPSVIEKLKNGSPLYAYW